MEQNKYRNGKIYKIVSDNTNLIYVGSTVNTLSYRLSRHMSAYKKYYEDRGNYVSSFDILEKGEYEIILIENFPCETKKELLFRERFWQEEIPCVNLLKAIRTREDRLKWYQENKEEQNERSRKYREKNLDKELERSKKYREKNLEKELERSKKYRETHVKETVDRHKKYRDENREKIDEYKKQYNWSGQEWVCEVCKVTLTKGAKSHHIKSAKHIHNEAR